MSGQKIKQAQEAAVQVVSGLDDGEAFNLIIYNHAIELFAKQPVIKSSATEAQAHSYIQAASAQGMTNLHGALQTALAQSPTQGMLPLVLFLTDGMPTSGITAETAIRDLVVTANPFERRVFTFGVARLNPLRMAGALSGASSVLPGNVRSP
jgi:Ca-activated chloride channel family protein